MVACAADLEVALVGIGWTCGAEGGCPWGVEPTGAAEAEWPKMADMMSPKILIGCLHYAGKRIIGRESSKRPRQTTFSKPVAECREMRRPMPLTYLSRALLDVRLQTEGSCGLIPTYFLCYVKIGTKGFRNRGLKDGKTGHRGVRPPMNQLLVALCLIGGIWYFVSTNLKGDENAYRSLVSEQVSALIPTEQNKAYPDQLAPISPPVAPNLCQCCGGERLLSYQTFPA